MLVVARLRDNHKNIYSLLDIWKRFQHDHSDWSLDVLGDGPDRSSLERYCEDHLIEGVTFHGIVSPSRFYSQSAVFLMTSFFEGFPLTIYEAMAFGVVPILYDSFSAASEMVKDGFNGLLVSAFDEKEFGRKLNYLVSNEERLTALSVNARDISKEHTIDIIGRKWVELLNNI